MFLPRTLFPAHVVHPRGCANLCDVGMIFIPPDRLVALQQRQQLAALHLAFRIFDQEGAATARTYKFVDLFGQLRGHRYVGSHCGHKIGPLQMGYRDYRPVLVMERVLRRLRYTD